MGNAALTAVNGVEAIFGKGANNGLGTFPEAVSLNDTYNSVMQALITNFKDITELVNTMATVLGKSASGYSETEAQLTAQFNKIVTQYETQSGRGCRGRDHRDDYYQHDWHDHPVRHLWHVVHHSDD